MDVFCSGCRRVLAPADVLYTEDARIVCVACSNVAEVQRDEGRAALNIHAAAWSCFGASIVAWFFNPFFIVNVSAILSGIYAIRSMSASNKQFTRYLTSRQRSSIWTGAILGLSITTLNLMLFGIAWMQMASHPARGYY